MPYLSETVVCFDIDDTLYKEIDFLVSAYKEIAFKVRHPEAFHQMMEWFYSGENVFKNLISEYRLSLTLSDCLSIYRNHFPDISLEPGVKDYLYYLKQEGCILGVISDGRSITQRNKIKALGLETLLDIVVVSEETGAEKPSVTNYRIIMDTFPGKRYIYVGDNPKKDFLAPNNLGWRTYCLIDDGRNIHRQDISVAKDYLPCFYIGSIQNFLR